MTVMPAQPKIYHILHVDRLLSVIREEFLWCDAEVIQLGLSGTAIGMSSIKQRRLTSLLDSHSNLHVGGCVPFYFCPRSVMLYVICQADNIELGYHGGQNSIVHLQADLHKTIEWANEHNLRWAFTTSNAGSCYFQDYCDLSQLGEINWAAVDARQWRTCKEEKQAEFLVEQRFSWHLIESIGVYNDSVYNQVANMLTETNHKPSVALQPQWYY